MKPAPSSKRRWLFALITIVALAAIQEFVARLVFPLPEVQGFNRRLYMAGPADEAPADKLPGVSNAVLRYASEPDGFSFDERLNLYGFRGGDFPIEKPAGVKRVAFFGDSYVEGCGVADGDTLPEQFAALAAKESPPVETLNLGLSGASLLDLRELVRDAVPLLKPDVAVIVICWNDLPILRDRTEPSATPRTFAAEHPWEPRLWRVISRAIDGRNVPLAWHSQLLFLFGAETEALDEAKKSGLLEHVDPAVLEAIRAGRCNPNVIAYRQMFEKASKENLRADPRLAASVEAMVATCRANDCRPLVAFLPLHFLVNPVYHETHDRLLGQKATEVTDVENARYQKQPRFLQSECKRLGVDFVDLTPALKAAEKSGVRTSWPLDGHCTAQGQRVVAAAIFEALASASAN